MKKIINNLLSKFGYSIKKLEKISMPVDFEASHRSIINKVQPYTMTSPERLFGLIEAVKYIDLHEIEGDIVECGVWKGGSMLAVAETMMTSGKTKRELYLYDTFEGMPPPTADDLSFNDQEANTLLQQNTNKEENLVWAYSTLDEVKRTMSLSKYPQNKIHYIKGKVEETIPATLPKKIALLRLDTDWYESTRHELIHLFPLLATGGVLIIDDYGFWKGARKAVDEFLSENKIKILLNRLDETGRIAVKQ